MKKKTKTRRHRCPDCGAFYVRKGNLLRHMTKKHRVFGRAGTGKTDKAGVKDVPKPVKTRNSGIAFLDDLAIAPPELHKATAAILDDMLLRCTKEETIRFANNPNFENLASLTSQIKAAEEIRRNYREAAYVLNDKGEVVKYKGNPFTKKSHIIEEVAKEKGIPVEEHKPAECEPEDFKGLPKILDYSPEDFDKECQELIKKFKEKAMFISSQRWAEWAKCAVHELSHVLAHKPKSIDDLPNAIDLTPNVKKKPLTSKTPTPTDFHGFGEITTTAKIIVEEGWPDAMIMPFDFNDLWDVIYDLGRLANKDNFANIMQFAKHLMADEALMLLRKCVTKNPDLSMHPAFVDCVCKLSKDNKNFFHNWLDLNPPSHD